MRHLAWLSGLVLIVSCSVNPVLTVDGSISGGGGTKGGGGHGGSTTGNGGRGGGAAGAGGGATGGSGGGAGGGAAGAGGGATGGSGGGGGGVAGAGGGAGGGVAGAGGGAGGGATGAGGMTGAGGSIAGHNGGGQGGHGTGPDAGETCAQLEADYSAALTAARKCTPGDANQCQQLVDLSLACPGCKGYVNDTTTLNTIAGEWKDQDCKGQVCPAIACIAPGTGVCMSTSGGPGGTCQNGSATTN